MEDQKTHSCAAGGYMLVPVERQSLSQLTDDQIDAVTREQWGPRSLPVFLAHRAYARAIERELAEAWGVKLAGGADKGGA